MTATPDPADATAEQMARDLVDHVKRMHTPRVALLEDRIAAALDYMGKVERPNMHTLSHIRGYLSGDRDSMVALFAADRTEQAGERAEQEAADPFTEDRPYNTMIPDVNGRAWHFAYWGTGFVFIREYDGAMPRLTASRDVWPYLIDLNYYSMRPADVTATWLAERANEWITDRNADIKNGNITD